jgi:hypothetical protein
MLTRHTKEVLKTMKKNTALLNILVTFTLLSACTLSFAEDAAPENEAIDDSPPVQNTTSEDNDSVNKVYVIPTPQISRISALETSLNLRHLNHQINRLEVNGEVFLTLHKSSLTNSTQGCVIILHSDNEHPDWPDAVAPLRDALPEYSWCTISIEVPDITKRAEPVSTEITIPVENNLQLLELPNQEIVFARIAATINKFQTEHVTQFTVLGYTTGAASALNFLASNQTTATALMLIDVETPTSVSNYALAQQIRKVPQPILDYYVSSNAGSDQFATWRKQAANQRMEVRGEFIQLDALSDRVTGKNSKQLLVQRVRGFLKQNTSQINQRKPLPNIKKGLFHKSP